MARGSRPRLTDELTVGFTIIGIMSNRQRTLGITIVLALAGALLVVAITKRGGAPSRPDNAVALGSMDDYLALESDHRQQIVFIGLDGATWRVIDPLIESGRLPTFARLKREGASGVLKSVDCYLSPPAWSSMMSGYSPEHTGVYTFGKWLADEKAFTAFSSLDVEVPKVWDIASGAGRRVAVTNVPLTYPATPLNGIMVTGLMTPIVYHTPRDTWKIHFRGITAPFDAALDAAAFAPRMLGSIILSMTKLVFVLYDTVDDGVTHYDTVALKLFPSEDRVAIGAKAPLYTFPLDTYSPWFHTRYRKRVQGRRVAKDVACSVKIERRDPIEQTDLHMTPLLRLPNDPELDMTFPDSLGDEIERVFGYYLITMTYNVDMILPGTEETARFASYFYNYDDWDLFFYVFQAPDNAMHALGFGDTTATVFEELDGFLGRLISELPHDATLVLASDHGFAEYDYVIGLNEYLQQIGVLDNAAHVDYDHTLVFHNQWCLYFNDDLLNRKELERRHIPINSGDTPRQALVSYLRGKCAELSLDGQTMPLELIAVPEEAAGTAPDMIVKGSYTNYYVEGSDFRIRTADVIRPTHGRGRWFHDENGIYLFWGNQIKSGFQGGPRSIEDVTPTVLYLAGLPLSTNFDGKVLDDIIRADVLAKRKRYTIDDYSTLQPAKDYSFDELESIEDKLRSLGYIR